MTTTNAALVEYANPLNWDVDENGVRRVWKEPGSETPEAYNGFELAIAALSTAAQPPADGALNTIAAMFHSGEEIEGPDGLAMMVDMSVWNAALDAFDELSGDEMEPVLQPERVPLTEAARDVLTERQRQISTEGWTPEHDDEHSQGEMAEAAACYAASANVPAILKRLQAPGFWPWAAKWWKPSDTRRDLIKAGALILAEIERLDRAAARAAKEGQNNG